MKRLKAITNWDAVPVVFDLYYAAYLLGVTYGTALRYKKDHGLPVKQLNEKGSIFIEKDKFKIWLCEEVS